MTLALIIYYSLNRRSTNTDACFANSNKGQKGEKRKNRMKDKCGESVNNKTAFQGNSHDIARK